MIYFHIQPEYHIIHDQTATYSTVLYEKRNASCSDGNENQHAVYIHNNSKTHHVCSTRLVMKTHFALLLALLPSITHGRQLKLRGATLQDEPKSSSRDLFQVVLLDCLTYEEAMGWFYTPNPGCTSNENCANPKKCMVENNGNGWFCGNPKVFDQDFQLCDDPAPPTPKPTPPPPAPKPKPSAPKPTPPAPTPTPPAQTPTSPGNNGNRDDCIPTYQALSLYAQLAQSNNAFYCASNNDCYGLFGVKCKVTTNGAVAFQCGSSNGIPMCDDE